MKQKFLNSFYALFLFTGIVQAQKTFTVTSSADDGPGSLRKFIAEAAAGDIIIFDGTVNHIILTKEIEITKSITITGNGAQSTKIDGDSKGGIFAIYNSGNVTLENMLLTKGKTFNTGGAIYIGSSTVFATNLEISNNEASRGGGGISLYNAKLTMTNCNLINNTANRGGALFHQEGSSLKISGGRIMGNTATADGGGISSLDGLTELDNVTIASNTANRGGGLYVGGPIRIKNSTISGNTAQNNGGGLYSSTGSFFVPCDISTSTFSGNTATNGGAIFMEKNLHFFVYGSTIVNNSALAGGGIYNDVGNVTLKNTIVAKNNAATNSNLAAGGNIIKSMGYNLIGQVDNNVFQSTARDLVGTATAPIDPKIGDLANNGGATQTYKLKPGSPAYNTGAEDPEDLLIKDQIGQTVFGGRRDIGAYEAQEDLLGNTVFDFKNSNSTVWPNPSNGTIKINLSNRLGSTAKGSLIETASGKTVSEFAVNGNSEINLQNYAAGLYIVKLESESVTENHKLIIQ